MNTPDTPFENKVELPEWLCIYEDQAYTTDDISDEDAAYLAQLPKVRTLSLNPNEYRLVGCLGDFNRLTDAGLHYLHDMTQLEELDLGWYHRITNAGLANLRGMTKMRKLGLYGCDRITNAGLTHLRGMTQMQELNLAGCDRITGAGLANLHRMTQLKKLNFFGCQRITDLGLLRLCRHTPQLRELNIWGCDRVTWFFGFLPLKALLPKCYIHYDDEKPTSFYEWAKVIAAGILLGVIFILLKHLFFISNS